jgi:hypothetical protein
MAERVDSESSVLGRRFPLISDKIDLILVELWWCKHGAIKVGGGRNYRGVERLMEPHVCHAEKIVANG